MTFLKYLKNSFSKWEAIAILSIDIIILSTCFGTAKSDSYWNPVIGVGLNLVIIGAIYIFYYKRKNENY
jgi:hypothetical protein